MNKEEMNPSYLILDFDNTIVRGETMDELARISLSKSAEQKIIVLEIEEITALGMSGEMPYDESLTKRINLLNAHKTHVEDLIEILKKRINPSILGNIEFFNRHREKIYIISGGFKSVIERVLEDLPFNSDQIFGNDFIFNKDGWISGIEKDNILSKQNGKSALLKSLSLNGSVVVVGDGISDAEMKLSGNADLFFAYTEHIQRKSVLPYADFKISSFNEVFQLLEEWD